MPRDRVRIGGYSAMWGDIPMASTQLIQEGRCDYLMGDYLAEVTMAIMARQRMKDPKQGYARAIVDMVRDNITAIKAQGLKIVVNAGGMNPIACREALEGVCAKAKVALKVGAVLGDDISD